MNKAGKTLVILSPGFPENEGDTTCLPAQQIFVRALNRQFESLNIIILSFQYPFISNSYTWNENLVIPLNGRERGKINRLWTWFRAWQTLKKIKKEYDIIGLLSFWCTECSLVGTRFAKKYLIKHYSWILGQDARKDNRFIPWIKPAAENLMAMSVFLSKEFYKNHRIKPGYIVPNGIDISSYPHQVEKRDIDIIGIGSLIPLKQYEILIRVVKKLSSSIPEVSCIICGKGPEEEHLRKMILDNNLQKNISLPGEKPHREILEWMARSKVLLHPSSYEGFSTVCLEALYSGAHVTSFCDPMGSRIAHWHVVDNEEEMAVVVSKIIQNPDADYGRILVYSMEDSARQVMKLFE